MSDYKLVPMEPTPEMVDAAREHHEGEAYLPVSLYKAMLAAAPNEQMVAMGWQFYQDSRWWNGDDRIKDHRKNTVAAGIPVRDVYAAPAVQGVPASGVVLSRDDLIQCLLATHGQSEGITADAILSMLTAAPQPAEQQPDVTLLLELLSHARCNTCDGSGGLYDNHGNPHQCQWCHDRSKALAAYRKHGGE